MVPGIMITHTPKGTLFIVEHQTEFREATQKAFEEAGYLVLSARDGDEPLIQKFNTSGPALAIVDLEVPDAYGREFLSTMRVNKEIFHVPILFITAKTHEAIKGANDDLRKPVAIERLLGAIDSLIAQGLVWSMIG
jgi:DNA-binding response OmpR family regulator